MPESKNKGKKAPSNKPNACGAKGANSSSTGTGTRGLGRSLDAVGRSRSLENNLGRSCDLRESYHTIATNVLNLTDTDDLEDVFVAAARVRHWPFGILNRCL